MLLRSRHTFVVLMFVALIATVPALAQNNNRNNSNTGNSPNDVARQRRIQELQARLGALRQQLQAINATIDLMQNDLIRYDRQLGSALYDMELARGNHQNMIRGLQEVLTMERQAANTLEDAQAAHNQVYARLRKAMAEVPQILEAKSQVEVARSAREETRKAVLEQLKGSHENYARLGSQRRELQAQMDKLRTDTPTAERDLAIQKLAEQALELDGRLTAIEQPALTKDGKFQEADAIFDTVTKRLSTLRAAVEDEARNHPDRIAVQQLVDDAKSNLTDLRARSAAGRAEVEAQAKIVRDREADVVRFQNWLAQRRQDAGNAALQRNAIISEIARTQRELESVN